MGVLLVVYGAPGATPPEGPATMITTTYSRTRAARIATARVIRDRIATAQAARLLRALRALNGFHMTALLERGEVITVSQALANLGADADTVRRYASQAGKKIKAAYLAAYEGREPVTVWKFVHDRPRQVAAYAADEPVIRAGLAAYTRTAHLVAA
ncbi:hypothetical protein [Nocardia cyriacigeorgica]|uniref:hypothetical protein n=1 Tax=Nocardia cyriacigeorgica TaxID=135487 RepID=UPI001893755C|nr:hypothetical protein [Nocardia cyriacigeorgica]MBF6416960.1 hypothetical protein [Nocardia cyriacigeorgica]